MTKRTNCFCSSLPIFCHSVFSLSFNVENRVPSEKNVRLLSVKSVAIILECEKLSENVICGEILMT